MIQAHQLTKRYGDKTAVHTPSAAPADFGHRHGQRQAGRAPFPAAGGRRPARRQGRAPRPQRPLAPAHDGRHPQHQRPPAPAGSSTSGVIEMSGLAGAVTKRVGGFSPGMSQRLGITAALLGDPERSSWPAATRIP
jgi:ABC-2 type transport system ATP-binding protein